MITVTGYYNKYKREAGKTVYLNTDVYYSITKTKGFNAVGSGQFTMEHEVCGLKQATKYAARLMKERVS